jgi:hypothetical protein
MVLLRITAINAGTDCDSMGADLITLGEIDSKKATEIHELICSKAQFTLPCLDYHVDLESEVLTDPVITTAIKGFFKFESIYNSSSYNFIHAMLKYIQYHNHLAIVNSLLLVNENYSDLVDDLTNDINNEYNKFGNEFQTPPQLYEAIGLITLKRRMWKYKNWELGITKIIGTYLNSKYYEAYIGDSHPELCY